MKACAAEIIVLLIALSLTCFFCYRMGFSKQIETRGYKINKFYKPFFSLEETEKCYIITYKD